MTGKSLFARKSAGRWLLLLGGVWMLAATPAFAQVTIVDVIGHGGGCPKGVMPVISGGLATVVFGEYNAMNRGPLRVDAESCDLAVLISVPAGTTAVRTEIQWDGGAILDEDSVAAFGRALSFNFGDPVLRNSVFRMTGAIAANDTVMGVSRVGCDGGKALVRAENVLVLRGAKSAEINSAIIKVTEVSHTPPNSCP